MQAGWATRTHARGLGASVAVNPGSYPLSSRSLLGWRCFLSPAVTRRNDTPAGAGLDVTRFQSRGFATGVLCLLAAFLTCLEFPDA